jgi:RNA polymerase sigma-54 factor
MEMAFGLRQEQTMRLAPQIIQSIEILQLPLLALEERLQTELIENPVLEMEEKQEDAPPAEAKESVPDTFDSLGEEWSEHFAQWAPRSIRNVERDRKLDAMQNTSARGMSLQDFLLSQVSLLEVNERQRTVLQNVICNIDANGYLQYPLEEILPTVGLPDVTLAELEEALRTVRAMDPPGVGACDLKECLLLQLDPDDAHLVLKTELIQNHLEDIRSNRFPQIAKETGRALEEVKKAVEFILTLNPKPGALFDNSEPAYIMPDVIVDEADDGFDVKLHESGLPRLIISPFYRKLLMSQSNSVGTKDYIRKKIQSARWLIDAIEQRRGTVLKVARAIVEAQKDFFKKGAGQLKPLRMQEVARKVGVHVSTVSRAIASKYMQTPQGIFEMRYFFAGGSAREGGTAASWQSIRDRIGRLVQGENQQSPFSDEDLAKELITQGVDVSRRTITKYRKALGIPSSRHRRQY